MPRGESAQWHQSCSYSGTIRTAQEIPMYGRIPRHYAAIVATTALLVGCGPDVSERGAAGNARPGDAAPSRGESAQPTASRDSGGATIRPPTTTPSPAEPGAGAPPAATPRLMARAEVRPLGDNTA